MTKNPGPAAAVISAFLLLTSSFSHAAVWYVDKDNSSGTEDGTTWGTAFTTIQPAIDAAFATDEVWVAEGTYIDTTDPVVTMANAVHLYGGFNATETVRTQRDWTTQETIIDGEGTRRGVIGANIATLDGFTVTRGTAGQGGGMYNGSASPTVMNCTFSSNQAGTGGGHVKRKFQPLYFQLPLHQ